MISEEQIDLLTERLADRIEQANKYFLIKIGSYIKQIRELTPTQAQQLIQILKYNSNYDDIVREIQKYTNLNIQDIDKIFSEYAKKDAQFAKNFYRYRNIPFVEYRQNMALRRQTEALANITKQEMYNFTRSRALGYVISDLQGVPRFYGLRETYERVLDEALLNVSQGKDTFDSAMSRIMKDIGGSGLKTVEFQSGRTMRLDSAVRMHLKSGLRELHNENQRLFGEEFGADGVEISVHINPAPDHEQIQGKQFSNEEYTKLNGGFEAIDYKGNNFKLDHDDNGSYRPISEYNCYHYVFSIILGVSEPEYSDKELQKIIDDNNKGFEYDGKHYSNYEGTQLQRQIERAIREQKDIQILAKASGNNQLIDDAQQKITQLTHKYNELSDISGLPTKMQRMRVSGYKRIKIK